MTNEYQVYVVADYPNADVLVYCVSEGLNRPGKTFPTQDQAQAYCDAENKRFSEMPVSDFQPW